MILLLLLLRSPHCIKWDSYSDHLHWHTKNKMSTNTAVEDDDNSLSVDSSTDITTWCMNVGGGTPGKEGKMVIFPHGLPRWKNANGHSLFSFGEEEEEAALELAWECFGGNKINQTGWKKQAWKSTGSTEGQRRVLYCGFYHASGCRFRVEHVRDSTLNKAYFRIGTTQHSDHTRLIDGLHTVPPQVSFVPLCRMR